jgi:alpha-beta hydrolase superfamily lysophospholipase
LLRAANARLAIVLGANDDLDVWSKLVPALRGAGFIAYVLDCDAD